MRAVIQRVSSASVTINGQIVGQIGIGLLVLLAISPADTVSDGEWLARKISGLRLFPDVAGQMGLSVVDCDGGILVVSQFTLLASVDKGARPSFHLAAKPEQARPLYLRFVEQLAIAAARPVATGEFGADMKVALVNDGPVTLVIDTPQRP